jgi:ATP-dependent DNA helicase RecQ
MKVVSHEMAFRALREAIAGNRSAESFRCEEVAFERLRLSLIDTKLSKVDRALRLRHALRYADTALAGPESKRSLQLPKANGWPSPDSYAIFGLRERAGGSVEAEPWLPKWLIGIPAQGVDAGASKASLRRWTHRAPIADPWITSSFGFKTYRGPGQSLAVRSALHMPDDRTLLVLLPTGEGKSLVFQALASAHPGQTVAVVVPTVALALDHAAALRNFPNLRPDQLHAYIGGQDVDNETIRSAVVSGNQGLLFAAPEAVVSKLRQPLCEAARAGHLAAIVIDEAHLVDAWGTDFRSEFQLLSALASELRDLAPEHHKPKVICLSATVTQEALETLETLFSPGQSISIVPSARLRPEPDIWIAPISSSSSERQQLVLEAICHLPRPAILYVTEQIEAERWRSTLLQVGFARVGMVHGGSSTDERKRVVEEWRKGALDLVVGTSAFGLGIDYSHVRTVIHACVPESLDRYYQEIGRSGRDNCASIALLVPASCDFSTAEGLASRKVITIDKGLARWNAMFATKVIDPSSPMRFLVDPTTSPGYDPDMKSGRSEDWNARVLNLMSRSGLIRLSGLRYDPETKRSSVAIDILEDGHLQLVTWKQVVEPTRQSILKASWAGFVAMRRLIDNKICPSLLFREIYQLHHQGHEWPIIASCGGCSVCRKSTKEGWFADWPNAPASPLPLGYLNNHLELCSDAGRCFVERDTDQYDKARQRRRLKEVVDALWTAGLRKCIVLGDAPEILHEALSSKPWCVAASHTDKVLTSNGLPSGPELVWVAKTCMPSAHHLNPTTAGDERIFLFPKDPADPANPGRPLAERFPLLPFNKFHDWLQP